MRLNETVEITIFNKLRYTHMGLERYYEIMFKALN